MTLFPDQMLPTKRNILLMFCPLLPFIGVIHFLIFKRYINMSYFYDFKCNIIFQTKNLMTKI